MAVTPEIKTRFTFDGLSASVGKLRAFGRSVQDTFDRVKTRTAKVFEPLDRSITAVENKAVALGKTVAKVGTGTAFKGLKLGAIGAGAAMSALALKISAIGAAAFKVSRDTADSLKAISTDAKRIGGSVQDVAVLGYAADATGTDRNELITQIATISAEFLTIRENVGKASSAYQDFLTVTAKEAGMAARSGDRAGLSTLIGGFSAADLEARKLSLEDIQRRIAEIDADGGSIYASGSRQDPRADDERLFAMAKERQELEQAREAFVNSQSPQGQALFELQEFGIDMEKATKGGVDSLLAIADAFQKIEDPSQKSRVAMRLFGEDAGIKLIPLLNGGRKAIDEYRQTLEKSGAIASSADVKNAEAYTRSVQNLKAAFSGVQLTVGRALWPDLTQGSEQLTAWLIKSREMIATVAADAFRSTRAFAEDAMSIFGGDTDNIQTQWLDSLIKKTVIIREIWADVQKQVTLLFSGKDTDYGWLNKLRDGFLYVAKLATQTWAVIRGGTSEDFPILNKIRDQLVEFTRKLSDAWDLFKGLLNGIHALIKPVLDLFGTDVTTFALFLGIARLSGVLGGVMTAVGLAAKAFGALFALGGGAVAAGAGAAGALGGATATAVGFRGAIVGITTAITGLGPAALAAGVGIAAAFTFGRASAKAFFGDYEEQYGKMAEAQAALIRANDNNYTNGLLADRTDKGAAFRGRYYGQQDIDIGSFGKTSEQQYLSRQVTSDQQMGWAPRFKTAEEYREDEAARADKAAIEDRVQTAATFKYDITIGGSQGVVEGDIGLKRGLDKLARGW